MKKKKKESLIGKTKKFLKSNKYTLGAGGLLGAGLIGTGIVTGGLGLLAGAGGAYLGRKYLDKRNKEFMDNAKDKIIGVFEKLTDYKNKLLGKVDENKLSTIQDKLQSYKDKIGNKNRTGIESVQLAQTSLPKIAEQQRVYLAKIYEVNFNTYEVLSKIYDVLGGQENLKYKSFGGTEERVYVYELGKFLTPKELKSYKNSLRKDMDIDKLEKELGDMGKLNEVEELSKNLMHITGSVISIPLMLSEQLGRLGLKELSKNSIFNLLTLKQFEH